MTASGVRPVTAGSIERSRVGEVQTVRSSSRRARTPGIPAAAPRMPARLVEVARPLGVVVVLEEELERGHEADDGLLADLAGAPDGGVGRSVGRRGADEVGAADEQARVLRAPDALAPAEDHEVGAHLRPAPEVPDRRQGGRGVDDQGEPVGVGDRRHALGPDAALGEPAERRCR